MTIADVITFCADFLKAIVWARKFGLRIKLDLHAVPGSQKCFVCINRNTSGC